jgi:hypothetical protein
LAGALLVFFQFQVHVLLNQQEVDNTISYQPNISIATPKLLQLKKGTRSTTDIHQVQSLHHLLGKLTFPRS